MYLSNERARTVLKRSLSSYLFEILWRSALLTTVLSLIDYFLRPKFFDLEDVWVTFIFSVIFLSICTFLILLMAAGSYRSRSKIESDENNQ